MIDRRLLSNIEGNLKKFIITENVSNEDVGLCSNLDLFSLDKFVYLELSGYDKHLTLLKNIFKSWNYFIYPIPNENYFFNDSKYDGFHLEKRLDLAKHILNELENLL